MLLLVACSGGVQPLMPTPVLYTDTDFSPLEHVPERERWIPRRVYYATNRARHRGQREISYGNDRSDRVAVGISLIGFGGPSLTWADLNRLSRQADRETTVGLTIAGLVEAGHFRPDLSPSDAAGPTQAGWLLEDLNDSIEDARDKDLLIYVHGAKETFYSACAFAAQLDHFMGRDMTSLAFAWPTRQGALAYVTGADVKRAYESAEALASLVELLAENTQARRIHLLSWSAGSRVVTRALELLRARHPDEPLEQLSARLRLGVAYFAAGEIPTEQFVEAMPTIHGLVDRVVVTVTSRDEALRAASLVMGGGARIGQASKLSDTQLELLGTMERLELIDVSRGRESRGFDITGHWYWYEHPWASSDALLAIRTDLTAPERGLESSGIPLLWFLPPDYPKRLKEDLRDAQLRRW